MSKDLKSHIACFIAGTIFSVGALGVIAAGDANINALLSSTIKMKLYGKDFTPQETDGTYVKPILYNGRTYLPIRNIAQALNMSVDWEGANSTIWLGGKSEKVPVNDTTMYEDLNYTIITADTDKLTTTDTTYKWGITNKAIMNNSNYKCYVKPNGKYKHFTASLFMDDKVKGDLIMEFRKETWNGVAIKTVTLRPGETQNIDIDIGGVKKVYIYSQALSSVSGEVKNLIIGEPTFINGESNENLRTEAK